MTDARLQAQAVLDDLVGRGALGAGLVGRDGLPLLLRFPRPVQEEGFTAMAAALLGAAEAALLEMAEKAPARVTVEAGRLRLFVAGLDDTHVLVVAAPTSLDAARLGTAVQSAMDRLKAVVGG